MTIPSEIPCCALAFWLSFSSPQMLVPHCRSQYVPHLTFSFAAQVLEAAKFASAAKKKLDELIKAAQEKSEQAIEDEKHQPHRDAVSVKKAKRLTSSFNSLTP